MKANNSCIISNKQIASKMFKMIIKNEMIAASSQPGQFVHIKVPDNESMILRRPISIHLVNRQMGTVDIIYQTVGKGTAYFSHLKEGDAIDVLGPLGNGFSMDESVKDVFIIGGGCGIAPLSFILDKWPDKTYSVFLGFRDRASSYLVDYFNEKSSRLFITSDNGSIGQKGFITDIVKHEISITKPDLVMSCGPSPMLKIIQDITSHHKIPAQISLEERMGCGIGGCLVCNCAIRVDNDWQYKRVCVDGPVFWSEEVIFNDKSPNGC